MLNVLVLLQHKAAVAQLTPLISGVDHSLWLRNQTMQSMFKVSQFGTKPFI
jgi:hypothetical protein